MYLHLVMSYVFMFDDVTCIYVWLCHIYLRLVMSHLFMFGDVLCIYVL
jgi:hypothetical protein